MITKTQYEAAMKKTSDYFTKAGIVLTTVEKENIEIADVTSMSKSFTAFCQTAYGTPVYKEQGYAYDN